MADILEDPKVRDEFLKEFMEEGKVVTEGLQEVYIVLSQISLFFRLILKYMM